MARVIAIDLGAESGRVMRVSLEGDALHAEEVHRFPNIPVQVGNTHYWDCLRLWHEIRAGIEEALPAAAIGVDAWGVDFALLDRDGTLLSNPVHYRDRRIEGMPDWVAARIPARQMYERTGIQLMSINTIYYMAYLARINSPLLSAASTFLTMPDLFNYWLSGARVCEFTAATTTQLYDPRANGWDYEMIETLGIPRSIFPEVVQSGTQLGKYRETPVIAPACHDTGSAVIAVPATGPNFAYLSSGTWSLIGTEVRQPVINDMAFEANMTNEGGAYGTFRLLKNVMGLWLAQQCQQTWKQHGTEYSYDQLVMLAGEAQPFRSLIDPDYPDFLPPGDMPARIREYCQRVGQPIPESVGQVMRAIFESLALKYRYVLDRLEELIGSRIEQLHIVGGGSKNRLLCQMTANAIGRPALAGPVEATALGNAIVQLIALGELGDLTQARALLSRTAGIERYEPRATSAWEEAYQRFRSMVTAAMF